MTGDMRSTAPDGTRPSATTDDREYSLTIDEVADLYAKAGRPCTHRTVQRYCAKKHLDARLVPATTGDRYLVAPYSVSRHIAQLNEIIAFTQRTASHDTPRPDATLPDTSRQVGTSHGGEVDPPTPEIQKTEPADARYVEQLERENTFLRDQIRVKDEQIGESNQRAKETNILIRGLQNLVLALQPARTDTPREDSKPPRAASYQETPDPSSTE